MHQAILERVRSGDPLVLLVAPFAKVDALAQLLHDQTCVRGLKVIVRWRAQDLAAGVADIEVYEWLKSRGASLYVNPNIHLKLYVFESNQALCTSANLTRAGLGYSETSNIEAGCLEQLTDPDWRCLYQLIGESRPVNDEVFRSYQDFLAKLPPAKQLALPPLALPPRKEFTTAFLPAIDSPGELLKYYMNPGAPGFSPDFVRRASHDLTLFDMPRGLSESEFTSLLATRFRAIPFVVGFAQFVRAQGSLRFGAANDWIHRHCEDVPIPYRWELKENTHILYNWLAKFHAPHITWSVPGNYSQVIEWHD